MTTADLSSRLDDFARRLAALEQELRELRELALAGPLHRCANLNGAQSRRRRLLRRLLLLLPKLLRPNPSTRPGTSIS